MKHIFFIPIVLLGLMSCIVSNDVSENSRSSTPKLCKYEGLNANCGQLKLNTSVTQYKRARKDILTYLNKNNGEEIRSDSALGVIIVYFSDSHEEEILATHKAAFEAMISVNKAYYIGLSVPDK